MTSPGIIATSIWTNQGVSLMARIRTLAAVNITQAALSTITYTVYDNTGTPTNVTGSLIITTVIFDTLQTDARWSIDSTGYNFRWDASRTLFPKDNHVYRIVIIFTPPVEEQFPIVYELTTKPPQG